MPVTDEWIEYVQNQSGPVEETPEWTEENQYPNPPEFPDIG